MFAGHEKDSSSAVCACWSILRGAFSVYRPPPTKKLIYWPPEEEPSTQLTTERSFYSAPNYAQIPNIQIKHQANSKQETSMEMETREG